MNIPLYILILILGIIIGAVLLRLSQVDAEQKLFDKQNKSGNITITPAPRSSKAHANEQEWRDNIISPNRK